MAILANDRTTSKGVAVTVGYRRPCMVPRKKNGEPRKGVDVNDPRYAEHGRPLGKLAKVDVGVFPRPLPGYVVQDDGSQTKVKLPMRGYVTSATVFLHKTARVDPPVLPVVVEVPPCFTPGTAKQRRAARRANAVVLANATATVPTVEVTSEEASHLQRAFGARLDVAIDIEAARERDGLFYGVQWGQRSAMVTRDARGRRLTDATDGGREHLSTGSSHLGWEDMINRK